MSAARGRGIATTALRRLRDWAAGHDRPAVTLVTVADNAASAAVARRAGFSLAETFEGPHRAATVPLQRWRWSHDRS